MYLGMVVELSTRDEVYDHPLHPYTKALLSAGPIPDPRTTRARRRIVLEGDVPSPSNPPRGCRFHPRCPMMIERCREETPQLEDVGGEHYVACWMVEK
jgi:oligopeptide/dipeptide ABC transporter ATP-binding protein